MAEETFLSPPVAKNRACRHCCTVTDSLDSPATTTHATQHRDCHRRRSLRHRLVRVSIPISTSKDSASLLQRRVPAQHSYRQFENAVHLRSSPSYSLFVITIHRGVN